METTRTALEILADLATRPADSLTPADQAAFDAVRGEFETKPVERTDAQIDALSDFGPRW